LDTVILTWDTPDHISGNISYQVFRDGAPIGKSDTTRFVDTSPSTGVHRYYVIAENKYYKSEKSNEVAVTI